jgi:organic radical activating enzyme
MFLDLKLGNICNLKCRICGSWSSSTFAAEEVSHLPKGMDRRRSHHYRMMREGAWPRQSPGFWQDLELISNDIRYIEFTGGEPFMINEHFDLLQRLVDRGLAHNIELHYNTNGTIVPDRGPNIWQHFRVVEVAFSVDDVGARFEYQRSNARWAEVQDNIRWFRGLRDRMSCIQLQVCSTVNVFNVMYLGELAQWNRSQDFNFVYWNMLHEPAYLSIASLPQAAKIQAQRALQRCDIVPQDRAEFQRIEEFMMQGTSQDPARDLRQHIRELDQRRGQNLSVTAPELADAISYEAT